MSINRILLLEEDNQRANLLDSLFKENQAEVFVAKNISEAETLVKTPELSLILLDYHDIIDSKRNELISLFKGARRTKFIVFNVPDDATRRIAFYKLGAYRILSVHYDIEDVYFFSQNLLSNDKPALEQKESHFSGRLQDFNLPGLINNFGKDKRSGVLRIQSNLSSGKVYFDYGHIYHASAGNLKNEEAILYMLTWTTGQFSMSPLNQKSVNARVQHSNVALLLLAESMREEYYKKVEELGGLQKEVCVTNEGDLLEQEKDPVFRNFVEKLSIFRPVFSIIENSPYNVLDSLTELITLKNNGNLQFKEIEEESDEEFPIETVQRSSGLVERLLTADEVRTLREKLQASELTSGKLLVLGSNTSGKTDFIRKFNQGSISAVRSDQDLDFTTIELADDFRLQLFGVAITERLSQIIEKLSENLLGYIFLVDAEDVDGLEFSNYIINNLTNIHTVPWAIAVTISQNGNKKIPSKMKTGLNLPKGRELLACDVSDKEDVRKVIMSLNISK